MPGEADPASPEIRKAIYTTNTIRSVNMSLRKLTQNRGVFPSDEALVKLFYLALRNISKKWTMPIRDWKAALGHFTIQLEGQLPQLETETPVTQNPAHVPSREIEGGAGLRRRQGILTYRNRGPQRKTPPKRGFSCCCLWRGT